MSIIHDALKKAQDERKKESPTLPYNPSKARGKSHALVYVVIAVIVVVAIFYAYKPFTQRVKPKDQGVGASAPAKASSPVNTIAPITLTKAPQKQIQVASEKPMEVDSIKTAPAAKSHLGITANGKEEHGKVPRRPDGPAAKRTVSSDAVKSEIPIEKAGSPEDASRETEKTGSRRGLSADVDVLFNEALHEMRAGRRAEAKNIYKRILAKDPAHIETLNNLGILAVEEGNEKEGLFYFRKVLEYRKDYGKAYNNMGLLEMKRGEEKIAVDYFRKAITLEPQSAEPVLNLSALLRGQKKFREAERLLEVYIQQKTKEPQIYLAYAVVKDTLNEHKEALKYYRQYLSMIQSPDSKKDILERIGYLEKIGQ